MATTKVTYKRGLKAELNSLPKVDGQLIITKDTGEMFADVPIDGEIKRKQIGDGIGIVDQEYNPTSIDAQSGYAVAEAVAPKANSADLANIATSGDYDDLIDKPFEKGEGNTSAQQVIDAEGGQPIALGKWSLAEGRGNNLVVKLVSKDLANNKINVAKYNGDTQVNGARDIRANAILWIDGAWYYVTAVSKTNPVNTLTLDAVERQLKDQDGQDTTVHQLANVADGTEIHAYMGAAAASASHTEGNFNNTVWLHSRYEKNEDNVNRSHAEGSRTLASGYCAHVEGENSRGLGDHSHVEGKDCIGSGASSHAEGSGTKAAGFASHVEGIDSQATATGAHAEGSSNAANGNNAHVGGYESYANGDATFAHGHNVIAESNMYTFGKAVLGHYNENNVNDIFEIGNGSNSNNSNAISVDYNGNLAAGTKPIRHKAYKASKTFTPAQTYSNNQMLIRIGQFAGDKQQSTIYNPRLRNVTTGEEYDISIKTGNNGNIVINSPSTANLKWDLRGGGDEHYGINILEDTIDNYPVIEIDTNKDGWRYLQYCINDIMTFNSGDTYEISVLSPYEDIGQMATLDVRYGNTDLTSGIITVSEGEPYKLVIGNYSNHNYNNAFEINADGTGTIQAQGNSNNSIVQKQYVDSLITEFTTQEIENIWNEVFQ